MGYAWALRFNNGVEEALVKGNYAQVRCVRRGPR